MDSRATEARWQAPCPGCGRLLPSYELCQRLKHQELGPVHCSAGTYLCNLVTYISVTVSYPQYKLPCDRKLTSDTREVAGMLRTKIREDLRTARRVNTTSDIWSQKLGIHSYIGLTAHFVNTKEKRRQSIRIGWFLTFQRRFKFTSFSWSMSTVWWLSYWSDDSWQVDGYFERLWDCWQDLPMSNRWGRQYD